MQSNLVVIIDDIVLEVLLGAFGILGFDLSFDLPDCALRQTCGQYA